LTIENGTLSGGSVSGGSGTGSHAGHGGQAFGSGIFLEGNGSIPFSAATAQTALVADVITDQDGNKSTAQNFISGSGSVVISAASGGTVEFTKTNTYTGGTIVSGGIFELVSSGYAGTGGITVLRGAETLV